MNNIPCQNCKLRYTCKPSKDLENKIYTGWITCNAHQEFKQQESKDYSGCCCTCEYGNVRCNNPDSILYNHKVSCTDTCDNYIHFSIKKR